MAELSRLQIRLEADVAQMRRALENAGQSVDRFEGRSRRSLSRFDRSLRRAQTRALQFAGALAAALVTREAGQMADEWTNLTNQLRQYEDVLGPVTESSERFIDTAIRARAPVDGLSQIMQAASRSARELGRDGDDVFDFMEAVGSGAAIANTGVAAVDGALTQLGQAIASPRVQLQEFNSIIEGTPRLAQAFADGVEGAEGSVARLRQMIANGEVSGGQLFSALLSQLPVLREEFSQTEMTIAQAWQNVRTATLQAIGGMDDASGASETLAGAIDTLAQTIRDNREELQQFATLLATMASAATTALGSIGDFLTRTNEESARELQRLADEIALSGGGSAREINVRLRGIVSGGDLLDIMEQVNRIFEDHSYLDRPGVLDPLGVRELTELFLGLARAKREAATAGGTGAGGAGGGGDTSVLGRGSGATDIDAFLERMERRVGISRRQAEEFAETLTNAEAVVAEARENSLALADRELQAQLAIAQARGDGQLVASLERELAVRQAIAELTALGVDSEKAGVIANRDADAMDLAQRQGRFREIFRESFSDGLLAALQGDEEAFERWVRDGATRGLERALDRLADRLFEIFSNIDFGGKRGGGIGGFLSGLIGGLSGGGGAGSGIKPSVGKMPLATASLPVASAAQGLTAQASRSASAPVQFTYAPVIDARGATEGTADLIDRKLAAQGETIRREFTETLERRERIGIWRGVAT